MGDGYQIVNETARHACASNLIEREDMTGELRREINKLKEYIFYLEEENSSLLKSKKVKKLIFNYDVNNLNADLVHIAKAKPESDFEENKV